MTALDDYKRSSLRRHNLLNAKSWLSHPGPVELPDPVRAWLHDLVSAQLEQERKDRNPRD